MLRPPGVLSGYAINVRPVPSSISAIPQSRAPPYQVTRPRIIPADTFPDRRSAMVAVTPMGTSCATSIPAASFQADGQPVALRPLAAATDDPERQRVIAWSR